MTLEDEYKMYVESYYGILEVNEYELKEYALKKVEDLITSFENEYINVPYEKMKEHVKNNVDIKIISDSTGLKIEEIENL